MPKLLSINNYYYRRGGAEVVFLEHNRSLEEIGWQVIPFAMCHKKNLPNEWEKYFPGEIEFGENYSLWQKAIMTSKVIYSFEAQKKISRLIDAVQPDIAHAHNVYHHLSPSLFATLKAQSIPTVMTLHDLKLACPAYKMLTHDGICERCKGGAIWNLVQHKCVKNSRILSAIIMLETSVHRLLDSYSKGVDRFVVPSRFYLEKMVDWGWPRERFTYIPNFVDIDHLLPNGHPGSAFVFFGRLGPEKGLATFVRAAALAKVEGWIVGTGPEEEKLRCLINETGANVKFLGYHVGESLFNIIRGAKAMVLPSEWYENAPMSIMEAYALERPVIGANIGGIPELIRENETGLLFPSGDVEALAECLRRFAAMPKEDIVSMGKAGRAWIRDNFTITEYRQRILELYQEIGNTMALD